MSLNETVNRCDGHLCRRWCRVCASLYIDQMTRLDGSTSTCSAVCRLSIVVDGVKKSISFIHWLVNKWHSLQITIPVQVVCCLQKWWSKSGLKLFDCSSACHRVKYRRECVCVKQLLLRWPFILNQLIGSQSIVFYCLNVSCNFKRKIVSQSHLGSLL